MGYDERRRWHGGRCGVGQTTGLRGRCRWLVGDLGELSDIICILAAGGGCYAAVRFSAADECEIGELAGWGSFLGSQQEPGDRARFRGRAVGNEHALHQAAIYQLPGRSRKMASNDFSGSLRSFAPGTFRTHPSASDVCVQV